jgi:hypothetical protein
MTSLGFVTYDERSRETRRHESRGEPHGRLKKIGLQDTDTNALCDQCGETTNQLLLACIKSREVWTKVLSPIELAMLVPLADTALAIGPYAAVVSDHRLPGFTALDVPNFFRTKQGPKAVIFLCA